MISCTPLFESNGIFATSEGEVYIQVINFKLCMLHKMSFQAQGDRRLVPAPDLPGHQDGFVSSNSAMRII